MNGQTRLAKIVNELVTAVGEVLARNGVNRMEYREGIHYLAKVQAEKELPLLVDVLLEHLVIKSEDQRGRNSAQAIQGPYFLEDVPEITGTLAVSEDDGGEPLIIRGSVRDPDSTPIAGATVFVWHSTPDGSYTGFHKGLPSDLYRGKLKTDEHGMFEVRTTMPVPYTIPDKGPVGALLIAMGRHCWRPAHVHFKIRAEGFRELTTQAYFEGGKWVDDDCAGGIVNELIFRTDNTDGVEVLPIDFVLDFAVSESKAA